MRTRFLAGWTVGLLLGCSGAAVGPSDSSTVRVEPQLPRAAFTMRTGSSVATNGTTLSVSIQRGETALVTLDASPSTPGSSISTIEWRINGEIVGRSMTLQAPLVAASTPYQVDLRIANAANVAAQATGTITVAEIVPTPVITAISPTIPKVTTSAQTVVVHGTGFTPDSRVAFTSPTGAETLITPTPDQILGPAIAARVALPAEGAWSVQVVNSATVRSNTFAFTVAAAVEPKPPPRITSTNPTSVLTTGGTQTVELIGTGFQVGLTVGMTQPNGNSIPLTSSQVLSVSETSIRIRVDFSAAGPYVFDVRNPDFQGSNHVRIDAVAPTPAVITGVTPAVITGSTSPQSLTILGTNFDPAARVTLRNVTAGQTYATPTIVSRSSTQITVSHTFPPALATWAVDVTNPNANTASFAFSVGAPLPTAPIIVGISPNPAVVSQSSQRLVVSGSGFTAGMTVEAITPTGGSPFSVVSAVTPTSFELNVTLRTPGTWAIRVQAAPGAPLVTATFTVKEPTPIIRTFVPTQAFAVGAPQSLFITGDNFDPACTVTLRNVGTGQTLANLPIASMMDAISLPQKQLQVLATITTAGTWTAQVVNPGNDASAPVQFTVLPPVAPVVLNLTSPDPLIPTVLDQKMFISGSSFVLLPTVTFFAPSGAAVAGRIFTSGINAATLVVFARIDSPGTWRVQVTNPGGLASPMYSFTVVAAP